MAAGDFEEEIARPPLRAPGKEPTVQEQILKFLDEDAAVVRESQATLSEASPVDLETSISSNIPEATEGEGGFSSFINDPRVVQAAVLGLGILGSQAGDLGGAVADGFVALGQLHEVRQEREQQEFKNRVAKEKINITRRSAQVNEQQLAEAQRSARAAEAGQAKRLKLETLRVIQEGELALKELSAKADAQKSTEGLRAEGLMMQHLGRLRDAHMLAQSILDPKDRTPWSAVLPGHIANMKQLFPRMGPFLGTLTTAKKEPPPTPVGEEPGFFASMWHRVFGGEGEEEEGDESLDQAPSGPPSMEKFKETVVGKVLTGGGDALTSEEQAAQRATARTALGEEGPTGVAPTSVAESGGVPQAQAAQEETPSQTKQPPPVEVAPAGTIFPNLRIALISSAAELAELPDKTPYFALDENGNVRLGKDGKPQRFVKGGEAKLQ